MSGNGNAKGFAVIPSDEISHRVDFAHLCNARGYKDAVEVGTDQGVFAREFLSRFAGHWLFCVDPYEDYPGFPYDRLIDAYVAARALEPFHGRFRFVRQRSPEAVPFVTALIRPEFVYVDGGHREHEVRADLEAWWAVLPDHGMLAGHDWDPEHPEVVSAVEGFSRERGLVVRLTGEGDAPKSWYIYRREPGRLMHRFYRHGESDNPHAGA